ncbi:DUF350 domain-containing protein [Tumidithrix elongata RA019]|uniref:DUF350 domain-containing protein n=1 Tax=Tumidithrix elongata BACA0141 TaxID=2716417 RepID=A0AAW9Q3K9_9CYAN|nr:DUF350 domain-containing protein [Tumidithrix elongata RA019]
MERVWQELSRVPLVLTEILLGFALFWVGQFAYQQLFRRMELNLQLFVRDNVAVAIALVGYYLGIIIALGGVLERFKFASGWLDILLNLVGYGVMTILMMLGSAWVCDRAILRRCDCAREIEEEHNLGAASLEAGCHVASGLILSSAIAGTTGTVWVSLVCWLLGLAALILASLAYPRIAAYDVFGEIQKRNNPAAGVAFAGLLIAVGNVIRVAFLPEFENWAVSFTIYALALPFGLMLLVGIRWLADLILVPGVKISDEIVRQEVPNLGAGLVEAFAYIAGSFLVAWSF